MRNQILETHAIKELSYIPYKLYTSVQSIKQITNQYNVAKNTSVAQWQNDYKPNNTTQKIILELLETNNHENSNIIKQPTT